jgi:hypothetical protein
MIINYNLAEKYGGIVEKLNDQKFNLIKEIRENFNEEEFFKNKVGNYKVLASIYKLFEKAVV